MLEWERLYAMYQCEGGREQMRICDFPQIETIPIGKYYSDKIIHPIHTFRTYHN